MTDALENVASLVHVTPVVPVDRKASFLRCSGRSERK